MIEIRYSFGMLLIGISPRGEMDIIAGFEPAVGGSSPSEDTL